MQADTLVLQATTMASPQTIDFEQFYRLHRADAVRWATALTGDREAGQEIAQEALAAVGQRLGRLDNPGGYLRRCVVNGAASWHRSRGRRRRREAQAMAGEALTYTPATNEMLDALAVLPYKQRAAITLRYWADWTDEQIAAALGCAPASVRVLLHRGIAALKKEIEP